MSIFKAYDIRGIYGDTLTEEIAERIGRGFVSYLEAKTIVVGRDMRPHSTPLSAALIQGMVKQGAKVIDLGLCSTPINYFANGSLAADGSVMITASHNPGEWNGFKMCRAAALPLSGDAGIREIERLVESNDYAPPRPGGGCEEYDIKPEYWKMLESFIRFSRKPKIAVDYANAVGSIEIGGIKDYFDIIPLYEELDGSFPNHEANPLVAENLADVAKAVREHHAEFGAAFDGDGDRCGFVDETGQIVSMDLITAILARNVLKAGPAKILYDLRSSKAVKEYIEEYGGTPVQCRVGHAFIKKEMRDHGAPFAGELSGHYYFKENFTAESSGLALVMLANINAESELPFGEMFAPLRKYSFSGEINTSLDDFEVANHIMEEVAARYKDGHQFRLDGISTEFADWWFNLRRSNTEPKLRLIVEANTPELMAAKRDDITAMIAAGMR